MYTTTRPDHPAAYRRDTAGSVGIIFALAAIPMLVAVGVSIDYARSIDVRQAMQASADAAALTAAASPKMTVADRIKLAKATFEHNFASASRGGTIDARPQIKINPDSVLVDVAAKLPTSFMSLAGISTIGLGAESVVSIPKDKTAEVALVLDYSGSMGETSGGQVKYVAMKNAAVNLVQDVADSGNADRVKFGLVPFSHHVRVSLPGEYVVGGTPGTIWTGCTQDRPYPANLGMTPPDPDDDATKWGQPTAVTGHMSSDCSGYAPRGLDVRPVSTDYQGVIDQLQVMRPYAFTHISLGFSFGWHLLDGSAPFDNVVPKADEDHLKFLVLLTDGQQTEPAFGNNGERTVAWGERNLETLCASAKQDGITVVTVAFDLKDTSTRDRLQNCSSDPDRYYFNAENSDELAGVFNVIKKQITQSIYLSR